MILTMQNLTHRPLEKNVENENSATDLNYCILGNKNKKTKILLMGDSFMEPFEFLLMN